MQELNAAVSRNGNAGVVNAEAFGFLQAASGLENASALQRAVDQGGTIMVSQPGIYKVAATVYVGSSTTLLFGNGVSLMKVPENGEFCHVILNKGALTRTFDHHISIRGLHIMVNGVDCRKFDVFGLHGQLAFFYARDVRIEHFRCLDLGPRQYGIHVCTFEDLIVDDVIIKGDKDGVHLGTGKRFTIRNGVFDTFDDAIALNAHDYAVGNPEMGWIEDGVIENCHELEGDRKPVGFFCRILAGAWIDWTPGMEVQQADSVISNGRLYRVQAQPDGRVYRSVTPPAHESGTVVLDDIPWGMMQEQVTYTAGVRNVVFRDIFLSKPRPGFSIHFDNDRYSRSYYPGAAIPVQEQILFDHVCIKHAASSPFLRIGTPADVVTITNSTFREGGIVFQGNEAMTDYGRTVVNVHGCIFRNSTVMEKMVSNSVDGKEVVLNASANVAI